MTAATRPLSRPLTRLLRDLFRVEPLESRILLSADPVLGAAQLVLRPAQEDAALALSADAYAPDLAVATAPGATVLVASGQGTQARPAEWLVVDATQLAGGHGSLMIGGADGNAVILVGEADGAPVALGDLVLLNPQQGGEVFLQSDLRLSGSLYIEGSGNTTIVTSDTSTADDIFILDSVLVGGNRLLEAGTDGSGAIQLGNITTHTVNGNGDATADTLVLRAPDNIRFAGAVGNSDPLEGLTIEAVSVSGTPDLPFNVTFDREVTVNGDLVVVASGTVTFKQQVIVTGGGDLRVIGAEQVIFEAGVQLTGTSGGVAGDLFVEGNEVTFQGGGESISGSGVLTLRPTTAGHGIELGTPPASQTASTLNIDNTEIQAFADGFSRIVIGHQDGLHAHASAGAVRLGAINALDQPTLRDPLEVYGGSIVVEDYATPDYELQVLGTIRLDAVGDITLRNQVEAFTGTVLADVVLYSASGAVSQVDATGDGVSAEPLRAAHLDVRAASGIALPYTELASVSAVNATSGDLRITETASGGDVTVTLLSQAATSAQMALRTTAGNIAVAGTGIAHAGSGATELQAAGANRQITVDQAITSAGGVVRLTATGAISTSDNGGSTDGRIETGGAAAVELLSTGGAIQQGGLVRSAGGPVSLDAATSLTMADGVRIDSLDPVGNTGAVTLRAGTNVTLSTIEADGSISVTAGGAILDGLTGTNPNLDGDTAAVLLAAASGIGTGAGGALQTRVNALAATNTTGGGVFVREATALRLAGGAGTHAVDVGGAGGLAIVTLDGAITVEKAVRTTGTDGHILLQSGEAAEATAAAIDVRADVASASGSISLLAADDILLDDLAGATAPAVSVAGAGQSLDLEAGGGIVLEAQGRLATAGGAVRLHAQGGDVVLGIVDAGSGAISIEASGSVSDAQADDALATPTPNLLASVLRLAAGGALGAPAAALETQVGTLAATAGAAAFVREADALAVGTVAAVAVNRIGVLATVVAGAADAAPLSGLAAGAGATLQAGGAVDLQQAVVAAGNLLVRSAASLQAGAMAGSTGGSVSLQAAGDLQATGSALVFADAGGTVDLASTAGAVSLAAGSLVQTDAANIRVAAGTTATLSTLDARTTSDRAGNLLAEQGSWGDVSVLAGGAIADLAGNTATGIHADELRLQAGGGAGSGTEPLEVEARRVSALAGAAGLFLADASALAVGQTAAIGVQRVALDASAATEQDAAQAGATSGGAMVVQAAGLLTVETAGGGVSAAGNLLLGASGGGVVVDAAVSSSGGHVSLDADGTLALNASVVALAAGRSIDLLAAGDIVQAQGSVIASTDGNVALEALGGAITFERVEAGTAGVRMRAAGSILDGDAAADTEVDIVAGSAQLSAGAFVGQAGAALETTVATLAAAAGAQLFVTESDGVAVGSLQLNVDRVAGDGSAASTADGPLEDLVAAGLVLTSLAGDIAVGPGTVATPGVQATAGHLRLDAVSGSVAVGATVESAAGDLTVLGSAGVSIAAAAGLRTSSGTVDVESGAGAITMADGGFVQSDAGTIRLQAASDVVLGRLDARTAADRAGGTADDSMVWGALSVVAGGSILDNAGESAVVDLEGGLVRLQAGNAIGASGDHLETEATVRLSALAGAGGVFLTEASALSVGELAAIAVQRVAESGNSVAGPADAAQAGIASGGTVVVRTLAGSMLVEATGSVTAAGNVLLQAQGGAADVVIGGAVASSGGHVTVLAAQDLFLDSNVSTAAAGMTVDLQAQRHIVQGQGTAVTSTDGNIALTAVTGDATLEALGAGTGGVRVAAVNIVDGDAAGDAEIDITASAAALVATGAIGVAGAHLETSVETLAAGAGGNVFLTEATGVTLGSLTIEVQRVDASGASAATAHGALAGLSGAITVLRTLDGTLTSAATGAVTATGNLLLQAGGASSDLALGAAVTAGGAISLGARDVVLGAASSVVATTAGASIDVLAQRRIDAQQGSRFATSDGNVLLQALAGSVTLERVEAGSGVVRLAGTSIVDGDLAAGESEVDLVAGRLQISVSGAVGTGANPLETTVGVLTVAAGGVVAVAESDGLLLDTVLAGGSRVGIDGASTAIAPVSQSGVAGTTVVVRTLAGALESVAGGGAVTAGGNVLLRAGGAASDLVLGAAVTSSGGAMTLDAGRDLLQNANVGASGSNRTLEMLAAGALVQAQGVLASTNNGHAALTAGGLLTVETVTAGVGRVSLAGAAIVDGDAAADSEPDVLAAGVRLFASAGGIGAAGNALETTTSTLAASASGDLFVDESDALSLAAVAVVVNRVATNGSDAAQPALSLSNVAAGTVVLRSLAGTLDSQASGQVSATGNVLLQALGVASDLSLGAAVASSGGHVSLAAGRDVLLGANVTAAGAGRTVDLVAQRHLAQSQGTAIAGAGGNLALTAGGTATLETVDAGAGAVRIAAASIVDGDTAAGEAEVDLLAAGVQLLATDAIGAGSNPLETSTTLLAAAAGGALFVTESDVVQVGTIVVDVQRVDALGGSAATVHAATSGLTGADSAVRTLAGGLQVLAGAPVTATGNLLLQAGGAASDLVLDAAVTGSANATLLAGRDLLQRADVSATGMAGSLQLLGARHVAQAQGVVASSNGGALAVHATGGDATLESLQAGSGTVRVQAGGAIVDGDPAGDGEPDVSAAGLQLVAGGSIGSAGNALETSVGTLAAQSGGDLFLAESDALAIGAVAQVLQRVGADGATLTDPASNLQGVDSGGAAVVRALAGSLTSTAQGAVASAGNLLLQALGASSDLDLGAAVASSGGDISLAADRDVLLGANVTAAGAGRTVDVLAQRHLAQSQDTVLASTGGNVALEASTGAATIESIVAGAAAVRLRAGAALIDGDAAGDSEVDIAAGSLQLSAGGDIAAGGAALETRVEVLAAEAGGAIFVTESDSLVLESVGVTFQRVGADAATTAVDPGALAGVAGAGVVIRTLDGALEAAQAVAAGGALLLSAGGAAGDLTLGAGITAAGAASLVAGRDLVLSSTLATTSAGASIEMQAQGSIAALQGSLVSADGNVQLEAGGSVTLEAIAAGTGTVRVAGSSVVDGDAAGDGEVDIAAAQLQLAVSGAIGSGIAPLEIAVATLSASAGSAIALVESDALVLDAVGISVDRVGADGLAVATATVVQSGVTGATVLVRTLAGTLQSAAGGAVDASGNLLLHAGGGASDLVLGAAVSTAGHATLEAGRDLLQNAAVTLSGTGHTLEMVAGRDLAQAQGTAASTTNADAALSAGGTLTLETLAVGAGRASLAAAAIVDGDAAGDAEADVLGAGLRLSAVAGGIGAAANAMETTVGVLTLAATGDAFLSETDALLLGTVQVEITRIGSDGTELAQPATVQNAVTAARTVLRTLAGSLESGADGAVTAGGDLLLEAAGAAADLTLGAAVTSSAGHVSLAAGRDLVLGASVTATGAGRSIDLLAGGDVAQAQGTAVTSAGGNVALQAGGTATFEELDAGTGLLRLAAAALIDGDSNGDAEVDLRGAGALLSVGGAAGAAGNALETAVATLALSAGGNVFVTEADALAIGSLGVEVERVGPDAATTTTATGGLAGLTAATAVVQAGGSLSILGGAPVGVGGNLLLRAIAADADLVVGATVTAAGDATLETGRDLLVDASVAVTGGGAGLLMDARRSIAQAQSTVASSNGGAMVLLARTGTATLESLQAGSGAVRLEAQSVVDGDAGGDAEADISAAGLQLVVGGGVGAAGNALETAVTTLAAQTGGSLFVTEADGLSVGAVTVTARQVGADGVMSAHAPAMLAGLSVAGAAVLTTAAGNLVTASAVAAGGNLLLQAGGDDLVLGAVLSSSGGHVSLAAGQDLRLDASIATAAAGRSIDLLAAGHVLQAQGTQVASSNGAIAVQAGGDAVLELLLAGTGSVQVQAARIADGDAAGDSEVDIVAAALALQGAGGIGAGGAALETQVDRLAVAGGAVFVTETDALTLDAVGVTVQRVDTAGNTAAVGGPALAGASGGDVVLRTLGGSLASTAAAPVVAGGKLLLEAGGTDSDLALAGSASAAGAALSLSAGRDLLLTAAVATTGAGATIDLLAQRAATLGAVNSVNGEVLLQALGGDLALGAIGAGSAGVRLVSAGNVADADPGVDISAARLLVSAGGAVGSLAAPLGTAVGTLSVAAGGTIAIAEADAVAVGLVTAGAVQRVLGDAGLFAVAAATQGDVASAGGAVSLVAQGTLSVDPSAAVRTTGTATITLESVTGSVLMDPDTSVLETGSGDIRVTAEGDIRPGALRTTGDAFLDARNGRVLIQGDLQRNGEDIDIFADDVSIETVVSSPGATLRIGPLQAVPIVVGGPAPTPPALHLDTGELALLADGFAQIVIGSDLPGQVIELRGEEAPLVFRDPLVLNASGAGGTVQVAGSLQGDSVTLLDAGDRTTLAGATITMQGTVLLQDQLTVAGANSILAAQGGSGSLHFTQAVAGQGGTADSLALDGGGGNVLLDQVVSDLDGLTITDAADVTFGAAVSVSGDLVIEASGTVTFAGTLTLTDGGQLVIRGGANVVFASGADLGTGDALLEVSGIAAAGGTGSLQGQGVLELRAAASGGAIHVGAGSAAAGALQVGDDVLRAVAAGLQVLRIGDGTGAVTLADGDMSATGAPVEVRGATLAVTGTVQVGTELSLRAGSTLAVSGHLLATRAVDFTLAADGGAVAMVAGSSLRSLGGTVTLTGASGLALATVDARAADGSGGLVVLATGSGVLTDANGDGAADVFAQGVQLAGLGPAAGAGDVLEVVAPLVRVDAPDGLVLRESGSDGRTYFNVLRGDQLSQALVALGSAMRVTGDLGDFAAAGGLQALAATGSAAPLATLQSTLAGSNPLPAANAAVKGYLAGAPAWSSAEAMLLSQRLLDDGVVTFASGQTVAQGPQVDYWAETLGL